MVRRTDWWMFRFCGISRSWDMPINVLEQEIPGNQFKTTTTLLQFYIFWLWQHCCCVSTEIFKLELALQATLLACCVSTDYVKLEAVNFSWRFMSSVLFVIIFRYKSGTFWEVNSGFLRGVGRVRKGWSAFETSYDIFVAKRVGGVLHLRL